MAIGLRNHRDIAEFDDAVRQMRTPAEVRTFLEGETEAIYQSFYAETSEKDREAALGSVRWLLLGLLTGVGSAWDEVLVEECLREGGGSHATRLAKNPAVRNELTRPLLRWCRNNLLGGLRTKNAWFGDQFQSSPRADAFRTLGALASRGEISHDYWLLRLARTEARLLPSYSARGDVLCAHPDSPPVEGWHALRHAEHTAEEVQIFLRILKVSRGDEYRRAWLALLTRDIQAAAEALEASSPEQVAFLSVEELSPLLSAADQQVRLRAIRAIGAARTTGTTRAVSSNLC